MSFALTTDQVRNQTKTVTRRQGWMFLGPGDVLQPVVKGMGLKKGEKVQRIGGHIRVKSVCRIPINDIDRNDTDNEGFPDMTPREFIEMYCKANGVKPDDVCTRIEFEYV
jgi:hypothetical protein